MTSGTAGFCRHLMRKLLPRCLAPLLALLAASGWGCSCGGAVAPPEEPERPEPPAPALPGGEQPPASIPPGPRGFLKGQLHAHTGQSGDSDTPPEQVAAWYARRGFEFLVLTDHNRITDTPDPPGLLTLPGVEITQNLRTCHPPPAPGHACLLHVNALLVANAPPGSASRGAAEAVSGVPDPGLDRLDIYARAVGLARDLGAIAQLNHPNFHFGADAGVLVELSRKGLLLVEIANQAVDSANEGDASHPSTEALWDEALSRGARIFGTATDDAHHYEDAGAARARGEIAYVGDLGFIMVRAEQEPAAIRAAIEAGDFYSSTGVILDRLEVSPESIALDVRGGDETTSIEVIGQQGALLRRVQGSVLRFDPKTAPPGYVRVRVRDNAGRHAWTQPVWPRVNGRAPHRPD
jgi:hypothetical protein